MSRYYDAVLVEFTDGTTERVGANEARVHEGVLVIGTRRPSGGPATDVRRYVLSNIRSWRWEDGLA